MAAEIYWCFLKEYPDTYYTRHSNVIPTKAS